MSAVAIRNKGYADVGLTESEYDFAVSEVGHELTEVELGIIGALWSEHCSYKSSKALLKTLPTEGPAVVQGPGENAGVVDLGDGLACVFKIESHNHPSQVEPYQGAATGVGGILRDIFTMGARPIALLDSLRFGPHEEAETRQIFSGVVAGIAGYGNCIGIPTVGGEIYFDQTYRNNCLVNVMAVGVCDQTQVMRAKATRAGDVVLLVGADTGRDGIQGANFASVELSEEGVAGKSAVQVGNPFLEKCLMEACLELAGDRRVTAIQDLGAAGLTSSCAELAWRGRFGIEVDVAKVARRETGMNPYEVMLSESQERMIVVVAPTYVQMVRAIFNKWDLHSDAIGTVTSTKNFVVRDGGNVVADVPLTLLVDQVPTPALTPIAPYAKDHTAAPVLSAVANDAALLALLGSPNIRSRRSVFRQYDHQVGNATIQKPGGDAAVLRVNRDGRGIAVTTDGNARNVSDPYFSGALAVIEAAQNLAAVGAKPLAVTNCLNFGNPNRGEVYWQMKQAVAGMGDACRALGLPVVSGNVSLHNETDGVAIDPTVVVGMVGAVDDVSTTTQSAFSQAGDLIAVVGNIEGSLAVGEFQELFGGAGIPAVALDLALAARMIRFIQSSANLMRSIHDVSDGGLATAIAESCIAGAIGCDIQLASSQETLFGEAPSRFVISLAPERLDEFGDAATGHGIEWRVVGKVGGDTIKLGQCQLSLREATRVFQEDL